MFKVVFIPLYLWLGTFACFSTTPLLAQVTSDGTVNTQVNQNGNTVEITGGETRGSNLFHSFQDFSIPTSNEAFFNNADSISNIFSRVTGGNISDIDGAIRANGSASLFLINPAGILFGENASLDLGGSFYGSTASSILFEDGEFSAVDNLEQPILTINAPIGLSFRDEPGDIINRSRVENSLVENGGLEVDSRNDLAFIGGDINFESGNATARGGNIYLGGLAEAGIVSLNQDGSLSFPEDITKSNITLTIEENLNDFPSLVNGFDGGNINIFTNNLIMTNGSTIYSYGSIEEVTGGDINITASENITIDGETFTGFSRSSIFTLGGGNVNISTKNLNLTDDAEIVSFAINENDGSGDINITASENITIDGENENGFPSSILTFTEGNVNISTKNLNLTNGGRITSFISGQVVTSGDINITASENITIDGETLDGFSSSGINNLGEGNINISTNSLNLTNGGEIVATVFERSVTVGNINIAASENITIDGETSMNSSSGIFSFINSEAQGNPDGIEINILSNNLNLANGGQISAETRNESNAGNVNIETFDTLNLQGLESGIFSRTGDTGDAGTVRIDASRLRVTDNAQIGVNNFIETELIANGSGFTRVFNPVEGSGDAGTLEISSDNVELNGGSLTAISAGGDGGNINLESDRLDLRNGGEITTEAGLQNTSGTGGNITINSQFIIAFPEGDNDIIADAFDGSGGDITIVTDGIFGIEERLRNNPSTNDITASSEVGISGNIILETLNIDPIRGAVELPQNVVEAEQTVAQICSGNRVATDKNSFTIKGQGGIVPEPGLPLNSQNIIVNGDDLNSAIPAPVETARGKIQLARGIKVAEDGTVILTAYRTNNAGDRLPQTNSNCDRV